METTSLKTNNKPSNDWKYLLSIPKQKGAPCQNCCNTCASKRYYALPLISSLQHLNERNKHYLIQNANRKGKPVYFYDQATVEDPILIKFTGRENYLNVIQLIGGQKQEKIPATIISPYNLTRNTLQKERQLVKLTQLHFEPLGFIKLPLHSIFDFHEYAIDKKVGLLILPMKDMPDYLQYLLEYKEKSSILPAIFQPDGLGINHG